MPKCWSSTSVRRNCRPWVELADFSGTGSAASIGMASVGIDGRVQTRIDDLKRLDQAGNQGLAQS